MESVPVFEFIFLVFIITLCLIIAFSAGLWRAIELQNSITKVITDLTVIQAGLDTVQTIINVQLSDTMNGAIATQQLYNEYIGPNPNPYTFNKWSQCMSTPFPSGTLLPFDFECDLIYARVAEGVHR